MFFVCLPEAIIRDCHDGMTGMEKKTFPGALEAATNWDFSCDLIGIYI